MAGEQSKINGKKGGRPPGKKNKATLEKEAAIARFQERVRHHIDPIFDSQLALARGCSYIYRVDEVKEGKEKKRKHVLVTDPEEIQAYLDDEIEEEDYYYITTDKPDNNAIRDMLDRTFGKPQQSVEMGGELTHKVGLDDLSALISSLPAESQRTFYEIIAAALQRKKVSGGSAKTPKPRTQQS